MWGRYGDCIYRYYCDCCWTLIASASMDKTGDLYDFDRWEMIGIKNMGHSVSEIIRELGFSRSTVSRAYREYTKRREGGGINSRANCKRQSDLHFRGSRWLSHIVHSQRSQTIAQTTIQLNQGACHIINKRINVHNTRFIVWSSRAVDSRQYHCSMYELYFLPGHENTENELKRTINE